MPDITLSRLAAGSLLFVLASVASVGCGGRPTGRIGALGPASAAPIPAAAPYAAMARDSHAQQVRTVSRVVRHWFGRYRERYSDIVRIETLVAHIDSPTQADVFVVATFTDAGSVDTHGRPILKRPQEGRYYRSVQLHRRGSRWHIESVRPT